MDRSTMVTLALIIGLGVALAQDMCGLLGNSNAESELEVVRQRRFYLDVDNPAPCAGNITSWTVCYYGPFSVGNNEIFWALYAIYRRNGSAGSNDQYVRVSDIFTAVRSVEMFINGQIVDGEIAIRGLNCYNDTIDNGDSTQTVEAGDILGACVFTPYDIGDVVRRPLNLVGNVSGESLLEMNTKGCKINGDIREIPSIIQISQLSTTNSRRLHLYANIAPYSNENQETATTVTSSADNQDQSRIVAIAAGSVSGGMVILLITVSLFIIFMAVWRRLSVNEHSTVIIEDNVAYTCSQLDPVNQVGIYYDTIDHKESTEEASSVKSVNENLIQNVAHEKTMVSLSPNVAYTKRGVEGRTANLEEDVVTKDNAAYGCSKLYSVDQAQLYDTVDHKESTSVPQVQQSVVEPLTSIVQNVAHEKTIVPLSLNVAYKKRGVEGCTANLEEDVVTKHNAAYGGSKLDTAESHDTTDTSIGQPSSDEPLTRMAQNVAYEETKVTLSSNIVYKQHQFEIKTEEECEYTYIL